MRQRTCPDWVRWRIDDVTNFRPFRWFDTCRWICQPLKTSACIYYPACRAPWQREAMLARLMAHPSWNCKHENRSPNPKATAIQLPSVAETCDDCGIGVVTGINIAPYDEGIF